MPRPMSGDMLTALTSGSLRPSLFIEMEFQSGTARAWSGVGTVSWNGHSWLGVGSFGGISVVEEGGTVEARGISVTLSGIDNALLADAIQEFKSAGLVNIFIGLWNSSSPPSLIADPLTVWSGRMDHPIIDVGGDAAVITITCESKLFELNVSNNYRYNQDSQQALFPGDLGFSLVAGLQNSNVSWGAHPTSSPI